MSIEPPLTGMVTHASYPRLRRLRRETHECKFSLATQQDPVSKPIDKLPHLKATVEGPGTFQKQLRVEFSPYSLKIYK